jgi:hypothetical protein
MVKTITYEDKSSPVHLDGVLKRHLDPPAVRLIHRTPTLLRRSGVLTEITLFSYDSLPSTDIFQKPLPLTYLLCYLPRHWYSSQLHKMTRYFLDVFYPFIIEEIIISYQSIPFARHHYHIHATNRVFGVLS